MSYIHVMSQESLNLTYEALENAVNSCASKKEKKSTTKLDLPSGKYTVTCENARKALKEVQEMDKADNQKMDRKFDAESYKKHITMVIEAENKRVSKAYQNYYVPERGIRPILLSIPHEGSVEASKKAQKLSPAIEEQFIKGRIRWMNGYHVDRDEYLLSTINEAIISGFIPEDISTIERHFESLFGKIEENNLCAFVFQPFGLGGGIAYDRQGSTFVIKTTLAGLSYPFAKRITDPRERSKYWRGWLNHEKGHTIMWKFAESRNKNSFYEAVAKSIPGSNYTNNLNWLSKNMPAAIYNKGYYIEEACDFSFMEKYAPHLVEDLRYDKDGENRFELYLSGLDKEEKLATKPLSSFSDEEKNTFFLLAFSADRLQKIKTKDAKQKLAAKLHPATKTVYQRFSQVLKDAYSFCKSNVKIKAFIDNKYPSYLDQIR